ncbi:maleate cis-trans isomerase family protein (plasmid) [Streptomyces sp. BI20]|uniref:maleate cis-trans isomerase family protein n=1 Tax=Streptomyces sp. BI20 TaxID=3403460 RepID=UPI003C76D74F
MTRLGILVIHNDPVPEREIWRQAPAGTEIHTARFACPRPEDTEYVGTEGPGLANATEVRRALDHLGTLGVDRIAFCFGSPSFFGGPEFDPAFTETASAHAHGTEVFTAGQAITAAADALGVRRPLVVMPPWFTPPTHEAARAYLTAHGAESVRVRPFDLGPEWAHVPPPNAFDEGARWAIDPREVVRQVREAAEETDGGIDGVIVPGSGFATHPVVAELERELGLPVTTANQAVLWYALRAAGEKGDEAHGSLFTRA